MNGAKATIGLACPPAVLILLITILTVSGGAAQHANASTDQVTGNAQLNEDAVPQWARQALTSAAATCSGVTAPILAAQIETESNWNPNAFNEGSQATGLAQFLPSTWTTWGKDGDGDGQADIRNPTDAIHSQAAYMCYLVDHVNDQPNLAGEALNLALASYNAGPGNVTKYGGIPPFPETTSYVIKIRKLAETKYATVPAPGSTGSIAAVIAKAAEHVNRTSYAWGGGTLDGPSKGTSIDRNVIGFDCSSLVRYAFYQGTNNQMTLPRTAQDQYNATRSHPVPLAELHPGDLLFWGTTSRITHVALYIGNGRMIEAPRSGQKITETTIRTAADYVGATRVVHPR